MTREIKEKCKTCVYYNEKQEYPVVEGTTTHPNCMSIKCQYRKITKDQQIRNLKYNLSQTESEIQQIYSHLGVEAFGEDIHEQALKEIWRLQDELKKPKEIRLDGFVIDCNYEDARNQLQQDILKMQAENNELKKSQTLETFAENILEIKKLENENTTLQKALELAVEYMFKELELNGYQDINWDGNDLTLLQENVDYFKTKATEIIDGKEN